MANWLKVFIVKQNRRYLDSLDVLYSRLSVYFWNLDDARPSVWQHYSTGCVSVCIPSDYHCWVERSRNNCSQRLLRQLCLACFGCIWGCPKVEVWRSGAPSTPIHCAFLKWGSERDWSSILKYGVTNIICCTPSQFCKWHRSLAVE